MSVPAYLLVPDGRGVAGLGRAGRPRPRPGQVPGLRPGARGPAGRGLRRRAGPPGPCGARPPTCAASASAPTGTRPTTTAATPTWSTRSWAGGARSPRTCGTCARALDVLGGPPAGRPGPDGHGRLLLRRHGHACSSPPWTPGGRRRGERLLLVVGRVAQGAVEHVRLPGALRHARADGACRRRAPWSPPGPLFVETGREDLLFPVAAAEQSVGRLRRVYDAPRRRRPAGPRHLRRRAPVARAGAYPFLDRHLGGIRRASRVRA